MGSGFSMPVEREFTNARSPSETTAQTTMGEVLGYSELRRRLEKSRRSPKLCSMQPVYSSCISKASAC